VLACLQSDELGMGVARSIRSSNCTIYNEASENKWYKIWLYSHLGVVLECEDKNHLTRHVGRSESGYIIR
jgi:hypothetical protein